MNLIKYFSTHIFSFIGYILLFLAIYIFFLLDIPNIPQFDIYDVIGVGIFISGLLLPILILHFIEWLIRRRKPNLLPKVKRSKCKYCRYIHYFIFSLGYLVGLICLALFILMTTPILIDSIKNI